jgi:16S rRNA G527 N7-methylase RsmG
MNKDFIDSINSAKNSNEEFFTVNFGPNKVKIFFEEEACDWVWDYKYARQQEAIDIKSELSSSLQLKNVALINYFYSFIIPDISSLNEYISPETRSILDIGAGIGLFDLCLNQLFKHKASFDLVEVEELDSNTEIKPVQTLERLMLANNVDNINIIVNKSINQYFHKRYDLIVSFRSWGYLYDLNLYEEFVRKTLNHDGIVITDLSIYDDSIKKFSSLFNDVTLIDMAPNNKRYLGKNLK